MNTLNDLRNWVEFAHDPACSYLQSSDEPYSRTSPCDCGQRAAQDFVDELIRKQAVDDAYNEVTTYR